MAEVRVTSGSAVFQCQGLGSGVCLVAFDPVANVTGMVQVVLPTAFGGHETAKPGKFADTGVPELIREMVAHGAETERVVTAYVGGAEVLKFGSGGTSDSGQRNCRAVDEALAELGLKPVATDAGGSFGRTVTVDSVSGLVKVRTAVGGERCLCNLREHESKAVA